MSTTQTIATEIEVTYFINDAPPSYGALYENIGRTADTFRSLGQRGEQGPMEIVRFFAERDEALQFLSQLQTIRDEGYPAQIHNTDQTESYDIFLHAYRDVRPQPCWATVLGAYGYQVRTTLTVTRLTARRQ